MELQAHPTILWEKYQTIMENFTYVGKEPETKEQLRYLFHNQRISVPSLSPASQDWNTWTEECIRNADWPGLWHNDQAVLKWAVPNAERFLERKKSTLEEKAIVAFLLDLISGDMDKGSEDLLAVCKGYPRDQKYVLGVRPFCTFAHGLYCLARLLLPENVFQALKIPKYNPIMWMSFGIWGLAKNKPPYCDC